MGVFRPQMVVEHDLHVGIYHIGLAQQGAPWFSGDSGRMNNNKPRVRRDKELRVGAVFRI